MGINLRDRRYAAFAKRLRASLRCPILGFEKNKSLSYVSSMEHTTLQGWRTLGGKSYYFRSRWEYNYAAYLQWLKDQKQIADWQHEIKTFWFPNIKRGSVSYKPDFVVHNLDGSSYWVEVKGYYDKRSLTKIKRFRKYFPDQKLTLIDSEWYRKNGKRLSGIIPGWESDTKVYNAQQIREKSDAASR